MKRFSLELQVIDISSNEKIKIDKITENTNNTQVSIKACFLTLNVFMVKIN